MAYLSFRRSVKAGAYARHQEGGSHRPRFVGLLIERLAVVGGNRRREGQNRGSATDIHRPPI